MEKATLLDALVELARTADLEVRFLRRGHAVDLEAPPTGACRVRGQVWILLSAADPVDVHIDVLADALRTHAAHLIEGRYLPPAIREILDAVAAS